MRLVLWALDEEVPSSLGMTNLGTYRTFEFSSGPTVLCIENSIFPVHRELEHPQRIHIKDIIEMTCGDDYQKLTF